MAQANLLYDRFPESYQSFLQGVSQGAGLSLDDVKILNAMETLGELLSNNQDVKCAFLFIPPNDTKAGASMIGRNYDYSPPFDQLAQYLTVTILEQKGIVPTAFISIAGEVYCPSCVNANGLFMELNNGTPSGGHFVNTDRQSLLINMLLTLQNSTSLAQVEKQMNAMESDFSLIVNSADKSNAESFEFSSTLGMKFFNTTTDMPFASTNFYLNPAWGSEIPQPVDSTTWRGVTRRDNLLSLASRYNKFDPQSFEDLMNRRIDDGGALWDLTIYQLIFDENDLSLYIKIVPESDSWNQIPLGKLFDTYSETQPLK